MMNGFINKDILKLKIFMMLLLIRDSKINYLNFQQGNYLVKQMKIQVILYINYNKKLLKREEKI